MGKHEAVQVLAEILHHVVALGFTVHQHVQPEALLLDDRLFDVLTDAGAVVVAVQTALFEVQTQAADLGGLRERTDGGGRPGRQVETLALRPGALGVSAVAFAVLRGDRGQATLNLWVVHAARLTAGADRCAVGIQFSLLGRVRRIQSRSQQSQLGAFLQGEGEPAFHFFVQTAFHAQVDRAVQQ